MMRLVVFCGLFFIGLVNVFCQEQVMFPKHLQHTRIAQLKEHDSLIYYQCYVSEAQQETTTPNGTKITSKKKITVTEKMVVVYDNGAYRLKHYLSSFTDYPNKKFAYLTLKESTTWEFELRKDTTLSSTAILLIAAFETKTHPITHYELKINKSNLNEVIVVTKKEEEQLIVEGDYKLNSILSFN